MLCCATDKAKSFAKNFSKNSNLDESVVPVFKNVGVRSTAKNYCPISLLSVVSKVFEKLVNNRIVNHLDKSGLFLFPVWF